MQNLKLIAVLSAVLFVLAPFINRSVKASEMESVHTEVLTEFKTYSNATIDDHFTDDCVMVVMTNPASLAKLNYSTSDFSEINCKSVSNLTEAKTTEVGIKLSGGNIAVLSSVSSGTVLTNNVYDVDLKSFNQILALDLEETGKEKVLEAIKALETRSDILYAGPNYIYTIETESTALEYEIPSYLSRNSVRSITTNDTYANDQWALDQISLPSAWEITKGLNNSVSVGVIDYGVDATHTELNGIVDTQNSIRLNYLGERLLSDVTVDAFGHGTFCAGIIGAATDNGTGISGVNWNVDLVSINVYDPTQEPTTRVLAEAVNYADATGIKILSLSLVEKNSNANDTCEDNCDVCLYHCIQDYLGLVICSAGNIPEADVNSGNELEPIYPAFYDLDNIISVGASTMFDSPWYRSYYDSESVDLFAPGAAIYSTAPTNRCKEKSCDMFGYHIAVGYHADSGTSYAAPYVAGVASLIMSKYPNLSVEQVKNRIMRSVDMETAYFGKCVTSGRLNAYKALHNHSFTGLHDPFDSSYHMSHCACGAYDLLPHNWVTMGDFEACSDCSYVMQ